MPALFAHVSSGCNPDGSGWLQVDSVGSPNAESIEVKFDGSDSSHYYANFPGDSLPHRFPAVGGNGVEYSVAVFGSVSGSGTVRVNGGAMVPSGIIELYCFVCDIGITIVATTNANPPAADGTATITATGANGTKEFSIDGVNWQASNVFNGLALGNYTARVRYTETNSCEAQKTFTISEPAMLGCTHPDADNYNPAATEDDGTCVFVPRYYPTGGTLPNPVWFERSFSPMVDGIAKLRHYVKVNIYKPGEMEPFAQKFGRVRSGISKIDVAKELQTGALSIQDNGIEFADAEALFPFEFGFIEGFNGIELPEVRSGFPKRYAVRAAMPQISDSIEPHIIKSGGEALAKFLNAFDVPVKFAGEPVNLSIIIDESIAVAGTPIYLERNYFDSQRRLVQRNSTQIIETGFVRFEINDSVVPCASYLETHITTVLAVDIVGDCIDAVPVPPVPGGAGVTIKDGAGNILATVPSGGTFVIESGFSFGFRIL